jgi:hypothetical protein
MMPVFITESNVAARLGSTFTWKVSGGVSRTLFEVASTNVTAGAVAPASKVSVPNAVPVTTPVHVQVKFTGTPGAGAGAESGATVQLGRTVPAPVATASSGPGVTEASGTVA